MTVLHQPDVARRDTRRATSVLKALLAAAVVICVGVTGAPAASADPAATRAQEWWISRLDLAHTWNVSKGAGVTVAVLDSGVEAALGDLKGAVVPGFSASGNGNGQTDTDTVEAHGTRMASEIAGRGVNPGVIGVAPAAKILPVVVATTGVDNTAVALDRLSAMPNPPQIVNMSYGAATTCHDDLQAAVKKAVDRGMILVASAGNNGSSTNPSQAPANCAGVIAVGAVDQDAKVWPDSQRQPYVALAGPGVHITGYYPSPPGVAFGTGTSDAAAMVSGVFADVRAHFPTMPSRQLVARVLHTARQFQGAQGTRNDSLGFGVARPYHALTDKVPASAANPIYDELDKLGPESSSSSPAPGSSGPTQPSGSDTAAQPGIATKDKGSSVGILLAIIAAVVIALLIIVALIVRSRRRRPGHVAANPGGYGPSGGYGPPGP
jgi:hypothetical protein